MKNCPHNGLPCILEKIAYDTESLYNSDKWWKCYHVAPRVVRYCPLGRQGVKVV